MFESGADEHHKTTDTREVVTTSKHFKRAWNY